jgi:hypothetical protein
VWNGKPENLNCLPGGLWRLRRPPRCHQKSCLPAAARPATAGGGRRWTAVVGCPFFQPPLPECSQPPLLGFSSIRFGRTLAASREFATSVDPEARQHRCRPFVDAAVVVRFLESSGILGSSSHRRERILPCAAAEGTQLQLGVVRVEQCGTWCRQGQIT